MHFSLKNYFSDQEVSLPPTQDVMLSFPDDSDSENDEGSSGFGTGGDEQLSEILSVSQLANIYQDCSYLEPGFASFAPFTPLKSGLSSVSGDEESYSGDEEASYSSDNILFTCHEHNVCFENPSQFETHQLESHMVKGKVLCGLCPKQYSTKYLRRAHFNSIHLKERFLCGVENCNKVYLQKRYKDAHEKTHFSQKKEPNLRFVCDKCELIVESLEELQQHRLSHSTTKKFPCRVCKKKGYTRESDRKLHETKCCKAHNVKIVNGIVVTRDDSSEEELQSARKNLFPTEQIVKPKTRSRKVSGKKSTTGSDDIFGPSTAFPVDHGGAKPKIKTRNGLAKTCTSDSEEFFPTQNSRTQPARNCKNGIQEGFYKVSPRRRSSSSPSTIGSPKASIKGKYGCSQCKQSFRDNHQLLTHIKDFHSKKKARFACTQCKEFWQDE